MAVVAEGNDATVGTAATDKAGMERPSDDCSRRLADAGEAGKELYDGFNDWSDRVSSYGLHAAYALIAANWAVYGSTNAILANPWAKWSVAVVVGFLAINLLLTGTMTWLYARRCDYANADKTRWVEEFQRENQEPSAWPYTRKIELLGDAVRLLKVCAPLAAGIIFIVGLFLGSAGSNANHDAPGLRRTGHSIPALGGAAEEEAGGSNRSMSREPPGDNQ